MTNPLDEVGLESQEFREALLGALNGQSEGLQKLIKTVDNRFTQHALRIGKIEKAVAGMEEHVDGTFENVSAILPIVDDIKFVRRLGIAIIGAVSLSATLIGILHTLGVLG